MISYFVKYDGRSANPEAFLQHYRTGHSQILSQFDGIRDLTLHTPVAWVDPFPVQKGGLSLLAQMTFDTVDALNNGLASVARRKAREDFESFPEFDGQIVHQALRTEQIF